MRGAAVTLVAFVPIALAAGCSRTSSPSSAGSSAPPATASAAPPATASATPLQSAVAGVFAIACEAECSDERSELTVYRDAAGAIGVVTVQGSPGVCSHPPLRFFGADGVERATIPLVPVTPGSPAAKRFADLRAKQLANLTKAETMQCKQVKH
jgi:hypothetical protein